MTERIGDNLEGVRVEPLTGNQKAIAITLSIVTGAVFLCLSSLFLFFPNILKKISIVKDNVKILRAFQISIMSFSIVPATVVFFISIIGFKVSQRRFWNRENIESDPLETRRAVEEEITKEDIENRLLKPEEEVVMDQENRERKLLKIKEKIEEDFLMDEEKRLTYVRDVCSLLDPRGKKRMEELFLSFFEERQGGGYSCKEEMLDAFNHFTKAIFIEEWEEGVSGKVLGGNFTLELEERQYYLSQNVMDQIIDNFLRDLVSKPDSRRNIRKFLKMMYLEEREDLLEGLKKIIEEKLKKEANFFKMNRNFNKIFKDYFEVLPFIIKNVDKIEFFVGSFFEKDSDEIFTKEFMDQYLMNQRTELALYLYKKIQNFKEILSLNKMDPTTEKLEEGVSGSSSLHDFTKDLIGFIIEKMLLKRERESF